MTDITPGIYDFPCEFYESDPCPQPSLRASGIKLLLSDSPAEFAAHHPRLTSWPDLTEEATKRQDEGSIAHSLLLGKGSEFVVKDPGDFLTIKGKPYKKWSGKARAWKEEQEESGLIVISTKGFKCAQATADAARNLLIAEYGVCPIGDTEMTVIWQRQTSHGPIWCRARLDDRSLQYATVLDLKTTVLSISDFELQRQAAYGMWAIQASWQLEGVTAVHPELAGLMTHRNPVVQARPPFDTRFFDSDAERLSIAAQRIDRACEIFAKCLYSNSWPGQPKVARPSVLDWERRQLENEVTLEVF